MAALGVVAAAEAEVEDEAEEEEDEDALLLPGTELEEEKKFLGLRSDKAGVGSGAKAAEVGVPSSARGLPVSTTTLSSPRKPL